MLLCQAWLVPDASPLLLKVLQAPASAPSTRCVRCAVECLTALAPRMVDTGVLEEAARACGQMQHHQPSASLAAPLAALHVALATQGVSTTALDCGMRVAWGLAGLHVDACWQ